MAVAVVSKANLRKAPTGLQTISFPAFEKFPVPKTQQHKTWTIKEIIMQSGYYK